VFGEREQAAGRHGMAEILPMTMRMTPDVSVRPTTHADLVATLEAPKVSSSSPTLEGESTLETFLSKQRRWLAAVAAAPPHLHPTFVVS
jgi:hypothetical protein